MSFFMAFLELFNMVNLNNDACKLKLYEFNIPHKATPPAFLGWQKIAPNKHPSATNWKILQHWTTSNTKRN